MSFHSWLSTWRQAYLMLAMAAMSYAGLHAAQVSGLPRDTAAPLALILGGGLLMLGAGLGSLARGTVAQRVIELGIIPLCLLTLGAAYAAQDSPDQRMAWFCTLFIGYLALLNLGATCPREAAARDPAPWLAAQISMLLAGWWLAAGVLGPGSSGLPLSTGGKRLIYIVGLLGVLILTAQVSLQEFGARREDSAPPPASAPPADSRLSLGLLLAILLCAGGICTAVLTVQGEELTGGIRGAVTGCFLAGLLSGCLILGLAFPGLSARAELMPLGFVLCVAALAAQIPLSFGEMPSLAAFFLLGESAAVLMLPAMSSTLRISSGPGINWRSVWVWLGLGLTLALTGLASLVLGRMYADFTASTRMLLLALAVLPLGFAAMFLFKDAAVAVAKIFFGTFVYHVTSQGRENLPKGGYLLIPNHVTWVDSIILHLASPRPPRFLIHDSIYKVPWLTPIMKLVGAVPISSTRAKEAIRVATELVKAGEIVCIFPEGSLSRSGQLMRLHKGFQVIARQAECDVVPVWMDRLWGSVFSFRGGKFFFKWPERVPYPALVKFGQPIGHQELSEELVRERLLGLSADCYNQRPLLRKHLGRAAIAGLKKAQFRVLLTDGMDGSEMKAGTLLAASLALSRKISRDIAAKRVSIVLPPGKGGMIANLAVTLANKVPVNLNFTAGRAALESAIKRAEIKDVITAIAVQRKVEDVPWPDNVMQLERVIPDLKKSVILWRIAVQLLPSSWIAAMIGLPKTGGTEEGTILFTSGSSGEPKGVVLSHRNVLGNVEQFDEVLDLSRDQKVLASLPIFHSFGCTVTLWWPLVKGQPVVTYPSPLEVGKNAELIEKYKITLMIATPTFLRGYLRRAKPEQLQSLELIVSGAEKLPLELSEKFKEKFGAQILEGYGLTETSPVVSVNMPDRPPSSGAATDHQLRFRLGSVGRPMPGQAVQVRDPDSGEPMPLYQTGMLWYRGANIFEGYLNDPERTAEVIHDEWFKSGDLGRMDEDGFLFIEGRLSRFSKIGGEMVPHATVENAIMKVMGIDEQDSQPVVVMGVPDEAKGEALVILSTVDIDLGDLRKKLNDEGIANLWVPKTVKRIEAVPLLASGKLDLKGCQALAKEEAPEGSTSAS